MAGHGCIMTAEAPRRKYPFSPVYPGYGGPVDDVKAEGTRWSDGRRRSPVPELPGRPAPVPGRDGRAILQAVGQ